jgi:hypothetical protein
MYDSSLFIFKFAQGSGISRNQETQEKMKFILRYTFSSGTERLGNYLRNSGRMGYSPGEVIYTQHLPPVQKHLSRT